MHVHIFTYCYITDQVHKFFQQSGLYPPHKEGGQWMVGKSDLAQDQCHLHMQLLELHLAILSRLLSPAVQHNISSKPNKVIQ